MQLQYTYIKKKTEEQIGTRILFLNCAVQLKTSIIYTSTQSPSCIVVHTGNESFVLLGFLKPPPPPVKFLELMVNQKRKSLHIIAN